MLCWKELQDTNSQIILTFFLGAQCRERAVHSSVLSLVHCLAFTEQTAEHFIFFSTFSRIYSFPTKVFISQFQGKTSKTESGRRECHNYQGCPEIKLVHAMYIHWQREKKERKGKMKLSPKALVAWLRIPRLVSSPSAYAIDGDYRARLL